MRRRFQNVNFIDIVLWAMGLGILFLFIWGTIKGLQNPKYGPSDYANFVVLGIAQGSMYALIAIGYTLVYGVLFMINFAHGEFFMVGAMTSTVFIAIPLNETGFFDRQPLISLLLIMIVAMSTSMSIAVLTERIAYKPLRKAPRLVPLITAIGASFFWQYFFRGLFGSQVISFPEFAALKGSLSLFGLEILKSRLLVIIVTIVMLIGLQLFIMRTKTGKAIRAVAEDKDVAALMGIDVDRTITITFATGAAMAGVAAVLYTVVFRQVHYFMGFFPGLKAFTAAVLGGIGSIPGAAIGGLLLGIFESVGPSLFLEGLHIPAAHQLKDVIAFTMLVLVLIFRPQGIVGERLSEKKA
ncbi:MAG TPA: branched-chain amino acid ABC transporter permease [Chloroflexi bacterium]|nr:branched-chain amino acid ABC transporter permease [Chloroflexota bacterium]HBY07510.1 branched-chain amino acid ABC transporter permease [Chloroflexota bacterium]